MQQMSQDYEQLQQLSGFVDPEESILLTNPDSDSGDDASIMDRIAIISRQLYLAREEMNFPPFYRLNSKILEGTLITQNMRARLRSFLLAESNKQHLLRETYTLAGNLVDLYFAKGGHIEIVSFQNLVIACLIIACKIKEGRMPTISFDIFSKDDLLNLEKRIAKRLTYRLNPITYHGVAQRLIYLWDCFILQRNLTYLALARKQEGVNFKVRRFYEELDCAFMVLRSLDYDLEELVINHFYLVLVRSYYTMPEPELLSNQQFKQTYYPKVSQFKEHFFQFAQYYSKRNIQLSLEIGVYLKNFLSVQTSNPAWTIKATSSVIQKLKAWDMIQSVPKDNYALAKAVAEKLRGGMDKKEKAKCTDKPTGKCEKTAKKK